MAITKKTEAKTEAKTKIVYTVSVERANIHTKDNGKEVIFFDMLVNGVYISDCSVVEYTTKDGKDGVMVCFPQRKYEDKDGNEKYTNVAWFPVSKELRQEIIDKAIDKANEV